MIPPAGDESSTTLRAGALGKRGRPLRVLHKELESIVLDLKIQIEQLEAGPAERSLNENHTANAHDDFHSCKSLRSADSRFTAEAVQAPAAPLYTHPHVPEFGDERKTACKKQVSISDEPVSIGLMNPQDDDRMLGTAQHQELPLSLPPASGATIRSNTVEKIKRAATAVNADGMPAPRRQRANFVSAGELKASVKENLMKPTYRPTDYYHTSGFAQQICRNPYFDHFTLFVIALNGIWIGILADHDKSESPLDAHPVFIVGDQLFCLFFTAELLLRFLSFIEKRSVLKDSWFMFDFLLVTTMIMETWVMTILLLLFEGSGGGLSGVFKQTTILRIFRLLRLLRMARMAKLLRAMPEIMVVINGMAAAIRTVVFTLVLMVFLVYVFAITLSTLIDGSDLAEEYFSTIPESMHTLLICGAFPDLGDIMRNMAAEGILYWFVFMLFALLCCITIMNMMIGVLVEVVKITADVEREGLDIAYLKDCWLEVLQVSQGFDVQDPTNVSMNKTDVWKLINTKTASSALQDVGVDVLAFVDFTEFIFNEVESLNFPSLMEVALQFRSRNNATVKDVVDLRRYLSHELASLFPEKAKAHSNKGGGSTVLRDLGERMEMHMSSTSTSGKKSRVEIDTGKKSRKERASHLD